MTEGNFTVLANGCQKKCLAKAVSFLEEHVSDLEQASTDLMAILGRSETVLMDGALGTELERRQLPIESAGWSALAVRDHGGVIRDIHLEYIKAGARLHIVNSFALARHVLKPIGLSDNFEVLEPSCGRAV